MLIFVTFPPCASTLPLLTPPNVRDPVLKTCTPTGDVGSAYTPAVGWAQAIQYRVRQLKQSDLADSIAVVFGGDGSVATNGFWSALTIATTLKLPVLFVIQSNAQVLL